MELSCAGTHGNHLKLLSPGRAGQDSAVYNNNTNTVVALQKLVLIFNRNGYLQPDIVRVAEGKKQTCQITLGHYEKGVGEGGFNFAEMTSLYNENVQKLSRNSGHFGFKYTP